MVQTMKPGSVIVDMAAEQGGNCELTGARRGRGAHGVTIIGYTDLASRLAKQSSTLYATNLLRLVEELCKTKDGVIVVNMEDDAIRGLTVIRTAPSPGPPPPRRQAPAAQRKPAAAAVAEEKPPRPWRGGEPMPPRPWPSFLPWRGLFWFIGALRLRPSWGTSRCSCWPVRRLHGGVERHARAAHAA